MTDGEVAPEQNTREPLEAAEGELARVRELLMAAGRGEASAVDVKAALRGYLDAYEPAIRAAAASVADEVRRQALTELYKWRTQLDAQLQAGESTASPGVGAKTRE
jgi:hypothetical protein